MASLLEWKVPPSAQPRAEDYAYDLERVLTSVVGLHSLISSDAFTADTLGVERAGNGVLIEDGLILTIGYLITEAETVWLHYGDGRVAPGHALGVDSETGFGLVQALERLDLPALPIGSADAVDIGERVVVGVPPFSVVIGNAQHVRVTYDDEPFDLTPHIRVEVARFTLK